MPKKITPFEAVRRAISLKMQLKDFGHEVAVDLRGDGVAFETTSAQIKSFEAAVTEAARAVLLVLADVTLPSAVLKQALPGGWELQDCITFSKICRALADETYKPSLDDIQDSNFTGGIETVEYLRRLRAGELRTESIPSDQLWCVHVQGPDDVIPAPDHKTAVAWAARVNHDVGNDGKNLDHFDPVIHAVAAPWPHSAESHAEGPGDEYKWLLDEVAA